MSREKFLAIERELQSRYIERDDEIHGLLLATLSGQHIEFIGPPGTAKSQLVYDYSQYLQAKHFQWLMTQYTTMDETCGPVDIQAYKSGVYRRITTNKLPEAHVAYLDEIYKAGSPILNTLLKILQERVFDNDGLATQCPLLFCVASSNELPDEQDNLQALRDRFLLRYLVSYLSEPTSFDKLLLLGKPLHTAEPLTMDEVKACSDEAMQLSIARETYESLRLIWSRLREGSIVMSDRRYRQLLRVMAAESWLAGDAQVMPDSVIVGVHILWEKPEQIRAVNQIIRSSVNPVKAKVDAILSAAREALAQMHEYTESQQLIQVMQQLKQMRKELELLGDASLAKRGLDSLDEMSKQVVEKLMGVS